MDRESQPNSPHGKEEIIELANEQLKVVLQSLKEAKKVLQRDWMELTPRERSALSRQIKELEQQQKALLAEIEMNSGE